MIKAILASAVLAFSVNASAHTIFDVLVTQQQVAIQSNVETMRLNWTVGQSANYNVNMGFISGTMVMSVASVGADGIWMHQDMDLGFAGKQKVETLIDADTGAVKKMIVNGKEEQVPDQKIEIISTNQEKITVPAGTFDSMHVIAREEGKTEEMNFWVNPLEIPMSGLLKQVAPGPIGEVTVELTAFNRN
jgi:hypothetical protein